MLSRKEKVADVPFLSELAASVEPIFAAFRAIRRRGSVERCLRDAAASIQSYDLP